MKKKTAILHKLFKKTEEERTLSNFFNEASLNVIPKPKTAQKKENYKPKSLMKIEKFLMKISK